LIVNTAPDSSHRAGGKPRLTSTSMFSSTL
jgi:hypothetical protein